MSIIPPLSIWSSIKIRPPGCCSRNSNEVKSFVSYAKSLNRMKQKNNFEPAREVINLRVPSPLRIGKEYPHVLPVCPEIHKKRASRKMKTRNIGHVTVPDIPTLGASRNTDRGEESANNRQKPPSRPDGKDLCWDDGLTQSVCFDEKFPDWDADSDVMEPACIPTVKPWTPQELRALSKRYNLMEDKVNPGAEKKKNKRKVKTTRSEQKTPRKQTRTPSSDAHKSRKSPRPNVSRNDFDGSDLQVSLPPAKRKPDGRSYHDTKLAELYIIQLGLNR